MKIISKFRDCYDSVLAMGREESIVYVRHTTEIDINENFNYLDKLYRDVPDSHVQYKDNGCYYQSTFDPIFFFICGKIYIVYRYVDGHKNLNDILYTSDEVIDKANEVINKVNDFKSFGRIIYFSKRNLKIAFDKYNGSMYNPLNIKYKTPVIVSYKEKENKDSIKLISNPKLFEYNFLKMIDPYTLFQEIQMYVGGVLGNNEPNIIEVSDDVKIASHGYNKWSFRNTPKKKRRIE